MASVPAWWLFEAINRRTGNWEYLGSNAFTDLEYYLLCTISFSTVMPAVFETAELARSFRWMERLRARPAPPANAGRQPRDVPRRWRDAGADAGLAEGLLSLCLDLARVHPGAAELLAGPPAFLAGPAARRLAAGGFSGAGGGHLRVFLGDVELLLVSEVLSNITFLKMEGQTSPELAAYLVVSQLGWQFTSINDHTVRE